MRIVAYILTLAALLLVAGPGDVARAGFQLPSFKNKLIELALDQVSSPGSFEITVEAIEDSEEGLTSLIDVKIADGEGVWLTLERLSFAWKPDALLSGELAITRLELIGVTVSRPPSEDAEAPELKPAEPSGRGLFDWPRAPLALSIEGVRLERVVIAEGVLPQAISFDAEGRAFDKGDLQELALSLRRTDAVAGQIVLAMQRDFAANTVKLEVTANEAPGGLIATAAGFPGDAPARLALTADGPPEDWRLVFDATVERAFEAAGRATLAYAERVAVDADFSVTPGPELSPAARTIMGDRATLRARVVEREDGMFEVVSGALASPALTLDASGVFATGADESALSVSLVALSPLAALAEGVEFERFSFDGKVTGPQGALAAEGKLGLSGLAMAAADAGLLALDGRVAQTAGGLSFDLAGRGDGLRIDKLGPEVIGPAALAVEGALEGDLLTLTRAALDASVLNLEASGAYDLASGSGDLAASLAAPQIAPVAAAYDVVAEGGVSATAEVKLAGADIEATISTELTGFAIDPPENPVAADRLALEGRVTQAGGVLGFDFTGTGEGLVLDQIPRDLTRELDLTARGRMQDGTLQLETLRLASPLVNAGASGTVALEAGTLALDYDVTTADLAPVAQAYGAGAAGALEAIGRAEGAIAALRIAGRAGIAEARFDGRSYGAVELSHDVTLGDAPEGSLSLTSDGGELGAAEVEASFRLEDAALTLAELRAQVLGAALAGNAGVDLDTSLIDGAFDLSVADLAPVGRFIGTPLGGAAKGQVTLTPVEGLQNLAAELGVMGFVTDGVEVGKADLRLQVDDALGSPHMDTQIEAAGVDAGGVELAALKAEAVGPLRRIEFSADTQGSIGAQPLSATLSGQADASGPVMAVALAKAEVTAGPDTARLRQPLALRIGGGTVQATGLDLALPDDAVLAGDAALRPGGFTGELRLARLPLALLQRWAAAPVTAGLMDLQAVFDTRSGSAGAEVAARVRGFGFDESQASEGGMDLNLDAGWNGAQLDTRAELRGDFGNPMRANLTVPLRPGQSGVPEVSSKGQIDGALAWSGDIGDLWALVPAAGHILDGRADLDLRLGGTLDAPRLSGRADLSDGEYQNLDAGTILTGLTIATTIAEDGTVNVALDGRDGAKGTVSARTALRLGGAEPSLDATVTIDHATLVRRDDVTARLSGDLALTGPVSDLALTGRLKIGKAEVRLINATPPSLVDLEGIRIKGAPEPEAGNGGGVALTLDLSIKAKNDIFVRGRGLDSEWKMDLSVTGSAAEPLVTGEIEKVRGQLDLMGQPFELTRGLMSFDGGSEIDPIVDLALELEANGIRGGIVVQGRASAPELHFASTPALPEDEVLPRLLFGQSKQSLSGPEAIQLAAGVATLLSGNAGPLDFARNAAGVDVLRVDGESVEDASVTVGRNIGKGVFVGARQGLGGQGSAVTVEVEVFDGVVVDTEFGQEGGSNIGISLRHDF